MTGTATNLTTTRSVSGTAATVATALAKTAPCTPVARISIVETQPRGADQQPPAPPQARPLAHPLTRRRLALGVRSTSLMEIVILRTTLR